MYTTYIMAMVGFAPTHTHTQICIHIGTSCHHLYSLQPVHGLYLLRHYEPTHTHTQICIHILTYYGAR